MVMTRSKSVKKIDRIRAKRKKVWDSLRTVDKVMIEIKKIFEHKGLDPVAIDMSEASLIMTAMPLNQEGREQLINTVEMY